jgi:hypothetical protein
VRHSQFHLGRQGAPLLFDLQALVSPPKKVRGDGEEKNFVILLAGNS